MDFDLYDAALTPFSLRVKQEAGQIAGILERSGLTLDGFIAYVEELRQRELIARYGSVSPLYTMVDGKIKRLRKRTKEEKDARKKALNDQVYGKRAFKP